jgi:hypothetical protein
MPIVIPAICRNSSCAHVWLATNYVSGSAIHHMIGNVASPCPKCGWDGDIPDGDYSEVSVEYFQASQSKQVASAIMDLQARIKRGDTPEQIQEAIKANPYLKYFERFNPKDLKDLGAGFAILAILCSAIYWALQSPSNKHVYLKSDDATIVVAILSGIPDTQCDTRNTSTQSTSPINEPTEQSQSPSSLCE